MLKRTMIAIAAAAFTALAVSAIPSQTAPPAPSATPAPPGSPPGRAPAAPSTSKDEAAIRAVVQQVQDGWNAHDGAAFAAAFTLDADYVVVNGSHIKGREAIEKGHASIFATIYADSHNEGTVKSIRFLRPDVALVHIEWNLEFQVDGKRNTGHAMNTMVMSREGEQWRIAAFHNTPIQQAR